MALAKNITTKFGVDVTNAYIRVERLSLASKNEIEFRVRYYAATGKPFFEDKGFTADYDLNGANPLKQAYDHLKKMPEFAGAADC